MVLERKEDIKQGSKPKLLSEIRNKMRTTSYSPKTIEAYIYWIKDYIKFNNTQHPKDLSKEDLEKYLTHLAVKRNVAALAHEINK